MHKTIFLVKYGHVSGERAAELVHAALHRLEGLGAEGSTLTRATDWTFRRSSLLRNTAPVLEDVLVYGSLTSRDESLDAGDGKAAWLARLNGAVEACAGAATCVRVFDRQYVHADLHALNAEKACSAREYVCLLPWAYLDDGPPPEDTADTERHATTLKRTMRLLLPPKSEGRGGFRHRRSAVQAQWRQTIRWHNFVRAGGAVPTDAAVWRIVDRFWAPGQPIIWRDEECTSARRFVRLHVSADALLDGQLERMVGLVVCVYRGLLPASFAAAAVDPRVVIDVPAIPRGLCYLRRTRLDWEAPRQSILRRVRDDRVEATISTFERDLQRTIASSHAASEAEARRWLDEVASSACPRVLDAALRQGVHLAGAAGGGKVPIAALPDVMNDARVPDAYADVLRLLREADASGRWPTTSRARARVLTVDDPNSGGSFSLRAPGSAAATTWHGSETRGNSEFDELVHAVFALERAIAPGRPPSSMVAVNRRASFLPHTDAGSGFGQSTSLIVGLGAYAGGDLIVEGVPHDIRYTPLTFDGWRERHWTMPFEGERFSLVWFTPADEAQGAASSKHEARYAARGG